MQVPVKSQLTTVLPIVASLDDLDHLLIPIEETIDAYVAVGVQFAKTDGAQGEGLFICLRHQVRPIHEALEVGTVGHAEHVADLMAGSLQAAVK